MDDPRFLSLVVIALMMAAFVWGRIRYDLVAACALLLSLAVGIVPYDAAFDGFSDDIVIIVGSALLVSAGVARSGIMEATHPAIRTERYRDSRSACAACDSGHRAFGLRQEHRRSRHHDPDRLPIRAALGTSPSVFLMPMAFGSLLGGLMTLIGTSPNIVVSRIREEITGEPFSMFDFTPVGALLAAVGIVFLGLFFWLVPQRSAGLGIHSRGHRHSRLYDGSAGRRRLVAFVGKPSPTF